VARFAGVDIGTTSVKGAVLDEDGTIVEETLAALPEIAKPHPDHAEQDADGIADAVIGVLERLWPFDAAALAGQINSHILLDAAGKPLTPVLSWADGRAAGFAGPRWAPSSLVSRLAWFAAEEPDLLARAEMAVLPRDYVALRLGATAATEASSWPDLTDAGAWRHDLPSEVELRLPMLVQQTSTLTTFRDAPVFAGAMDSLAAVLGCGPTPIGTAIDVGGTSETAGTVFALADHVSAVRGVIQLPDGWWHAGPSHAGGRTLAWAAKALGFASGDVEALLAAAAAAPDEPTGLVFVPYLDGERMPLWNQDAVGGIVGLRSRHDERHLARAALEGVAFAIRHILQAVTPADAKGATSLVVCGGTARSALWNQVKADITGLPTAVPRASETGVIGAAMIAAAGLTTQSVAELRQVMAPERLTLKPNGATQEAYSRLYEQYLALSVSLTESAARHTSQVEFAR
jgi:xylulokinase